MEIKYIDYFSGDVCIIQLAFPSLQVTTNEAGARYVDRIIYPRLAPKTTISNKTNKYRYVFPQKDKK